MMSIQLIRKNDAGEMRIVSAGVPVPASRRVGPSLSGRPVETEGHIAGLKSRRFEKLCYNRSASAFSNLIWSAVNPRMPSASFSVAIAS